MTLDEALRLLERIPALREDCDLDLLVFFARHPRSFLASESIASFLGYELKKIADSLEVLLAAGLLTRTQTRAHAARLYVLATDDRPGGTNDDWLPSLLAVAATREGRLVLRQALARRRRETSGGFTAPEQSDVQPLPGPRRIVQAGRRIRTES